MGAPGGPSTGTTVLSNLSLTGALVAASAAVGGGTTLTRIAKGTVSIVTMTVGANYSLSTTATITGATTSDVIVINPPITSGLSLGLTVQARISAAATATIVFSNVSTAQTVQAGPVNYPYVLIRS